MVVPEDLSIEQRKQALVVRRLNVVSNLVSDALSSCDKVHEFLHSEVPYTDDERVLEAARTLDATILQARETLVQAHREAGHANHLAHEGISLLHPATCSTQGDYARIVGGRFNRTSGEES